MGASDLLTWLSTTDANITYTSGPVSRDVGGNVMVVYCTKRTQSVCGGECTVYNGGAKCINAPGTSCLMATANVGFCDRGNCISTFPDLLSSYRSYFDKLRRVRCTRPISALSAHVTPCHARKSAVWAQIYYMYATEHMSTIYNK